MSVKDQNLQTPDTLTSDAQLCVEIWTRVSMASSSFGRLRNTVWGRKALNLTNKRLVCETLTTYARHTYTILNRFNINSLRTILQIRWEPKVPDMKVLERSGLWFIQTLLRKGTNSLLGWTWHHNWRWTNFKETSYCQLSESKRVFRSIINWSDKALTHTLSYKINTSQSI